MKGTLIGCLVFVPGLVACSAEITTTDAEAHQVTALVEIDRTEGSPGEAIARFARSRAADPIALAEIPALGTCSVASAPATTSPTLLLDVGSVTLEGSGVRTALVPRRLPDVVDLVSGVVYAARGPEEGAFSSGPYVLRVGGALSEIPPFSFRAEAPSAPAILKVAEQDPSGVVTVDGATEIAWEPGSDVIVIEVSGAPKTTRCAFADTGHALVPAASLGAQGTITVHRVHRESFVTPGVDRGEVRFDFARAVPYRHR